MRAREAGFGNICLFLDIWSMPDFLPLAASLMIGLLPLNFVQYLLFANFTFLRAYSFES